MGTSDFLDFVSLDLVYNYFPLTQGEPACKLNMDARRRQRRVSLSDVSFFGQENSSNYIILPDSELPTPRELAS